MRIHAGFLAFILLFALLVPLAAGRSTAAAAPADCLAGQTQGEVIDGIIAILIGYTAPPAILSTDAARTSCPALAILPYMEGDNFGSWLGMDDDEVWAHYRSGDSLAVIAIANGLQRASAIAALQQLYTAALDRARTAGALGAHGQQILANRILPQFGWLVDWVHGSFFGVKGGEVSIESLDLLVATCVPGADSTARSDNLVRLVLGLTVNGLGGADKLNDCTGPFGLIAAADLGAVAPGIFTSPEYFSAYPSGQSLAEIVLAEHDVTFLNNLYRDIRDRLDQTADDAVDAGRLAASDRDHTVGTAFMIIVVTFNHHRGDPLPTATAWTAPDANADPGN